MDVDGLWRSIAMAQNGWCASPVACVFADPDKEFNGQRPQENLVSAENTSQSIAMPMAAERWQARHLIESLRVGVAPAQRIRDLTIGLEAERKSLGQALNQAHSEGGAARAVLGEYGYGKSHVIELTTQEALDCNFLVAATSLDLQELPPHRAFDIYGSLMRNLRYPQGDERGLGPLMAEIAKTPALRAKFSEIAPEEKRSTGLRSAGAQRNFLLL